MNFVISAEVVLGLEAILISHRAIVPRFCPKGPRIEKIQDFEIFKRD